MDKLEFLRWCAAATADIKYKPDRERVSDELYAHLEDRCAAMTDAGVPEAEAVKRSLAAMGSASETAEQLAKIHRPFWGYLLRTARWLLLISAVIALFTVPRWMLRQEINVGYDPYDDKYFARSEIERDDGLRSERTFYAEPMARDKSDGARFTLTKAAEWHVSGTLPDGAETDSYEFYICVEVFNPRPWAQYSETMREFCAVDSLGNRYKAYAESFRLHDQALLGSYMRSGYFTQTWHMFLAEYCSRGAEWIELRYDQSGRDVRLRIDLTGGDAA